MAEIIKEAFDIFVDKVLKYKPKKKKKRKKMIQAAKVQVLSKD